MKTGLKMPGYMSSGALLFSLLVVLQGMTLPNASAAKISISCGAVGQELALCKQGAEAWAKQTGHEVKIAVTPDSSSERLDLYQKILNAGAADIDVLQLDVVWPGLLSEHLLDLDKFVSDEIKSGFFSTMIKNNVLKGKLLALPWYTDAGLLFYRKDLLKKYGLSAPETWEDLTAAAAEVQVAERKSGKNKFWGYVWQGRAYEGLTCNALEWMLSYRAGAIVAADGILTVNNPKTVQALTQAASWIGSISPPEVLGYGEEEARNMFQSGNAAFMRNWPYAWLLLNNKDSPVKDKVGVMLMPKAGEHGRHASILGGWGLAISRYSRHPELAAGLVLYLTSLQEQRRRAIIGGYAPTLPQLYFDIELLSVNPMFSLLPDVFANTLPRPSNITGKSYPAVSKEFWTTVHAVLEGQTSPNDGLIQLDTKLTPLLRNVSR